MISIIIPTHNDSHLYSHIKEIESALVGIGYEIIIVDDHSDTPVRDNFSDKVIVVHNVKNIGKGYTLQKGIRLSTKKYIAFLDADLQIHPKEIMTFLSLLKLYDADAVIGNKRHLYSNVSYSGTRWIVSNVYNFMTRMMFGFTLRDTQCGLKLFKRSVLVETFYDIDRYAFDLELLVRLREKGYRIIDAPVKVYKAYGSGSVSIKSIVYTFIDTLKIWIKKNKGKYGHSSGVNSHTHDR